MFLIGGVVGEPWFPTYRFRTFLSSPADIFFCKASATCLAAGLANRGIFEPSLIFPRGILKPIIAFPKGCL